MGFEEELGRVWLLGIGRGSAEDERPCRPPLAGFCNFPEDGTDGREDDAEADAGAGDGRDSGLLL